MNQSVKAQVETTEDLSVRQHPQEIQTKDQLTKHANKQLHETTITFWSLFTPHHPHHPHHPHLCRHWYDDMVSSNLIYVAASLLSLLGGQFFCGILQLGASIASTAFHRTRETKYLHLDACVSSFLGAIWIWAGIQVYLNGWYGFLFALVLQAFACIFTFVYCGFPGDEQYDRWHLAWHWASGISTASISLFLVWYFPEFDFMVLEGFAETLVDIFIFS